MLHKHFSDSFHLASFSVTYRSLRDHKIVSIYLKPWIYIPYFSNSGTSLFFPDLNFATLGSILIIFPEPRFEVFFAAVWKRLLNTEFRLSRWSQTVYIIPANLVYKSSFLAITQNFCKSFFCNLCLGFHLFELVKVIFIKSFTISVW